MVRLLVDGDACPVKAEISQLAEIYAFDWWIFIDVSHILEIAGAHIVYCDTQKDSADLALMKEAKAGDIVITADLGLAALALSKNCQVLDFDGRMITSKEIESLLFERYMHQKLRHQKKYLKSKKARQNQDNQNFYRACQKCLEENHVAKRIGNGN